MIIRGNTNPIAYYDILEFEENYFPFLIIPELYKSVLEKLYKSSPRDYKKFFIPNHYIKSKAFKYVYYFYMSIIDASIHAYEYRYYIKNKPNHTKYEQYHKLDKNDIDKAIDKLKQIGSRRPINKEINDLADYLNELSLSDVNDCFEFIKMIREKMNENK